MVKLSGAQALLEALQRNGVDVIFGISGGALLPIHDALPNYKIRHILARHEQCAAHAADGFARASGRPGVCMATSGPGATNLVTGIANAYLDSSPIIAITGQVNTVAPNSSYVIGRDAFQEADIIGITTPITKSNYQLTQASKIPETVKLAFHIATTGRPGPVLIDFPKNVQTDTAEMKFPNHVTVRGYRPTIEPHPIQIKKAADLLLRAERPTVLAGGGVISSNASPELGQLAELLLMPVATTFMGKGSFPENHPLSLGNVGMHGTLAANKLLLEADVLLAIGTRFSDRTTGILDQFCPDATIIHVDIDTAEIGKNVEVAVPIVADAKKTLEQIHAVLTSKTQAKKKSAWRKRVVAVKEQLQQITEDNNKSMKTPSLLRELRKILPKDAIVATEVGQNQMWAALHFQTYHPRTFISSGGLGTMGFGFPAAIGAKVAQPDKVVVDIAGDGSFIMTEQELASSVMENIPVTVIVLNNSVLGMVAQWQRLFYDKRYSGITLGDLPNFVQLAQAFGAQGFRAESKREFSDAVKTAITSEVTTVIDVPISSEENVFPMIPPGKGLRDTVSG